LTQDKRESAFRPVASNPAEPHGPIKIINPGFANSQPIPADAEFPLGASIPLKILCAACGEEIKKISPGSLPFREGPYKGGYICSDCLVLSLAEDPKAQRSVRIEAERIRARRAQWRKELLFDDPECKAWLTDRGTILLQIKRLEFGAAEEFDPDRFRLFMKAFAQVAKKIPGYELFYEVPKAEPEKPHGEGTATRFS